MKALILQKAALLVLATSGAVVAVPQKEDITLEIQGRNRTVDSRRHRDRLYFRLRDVTEIFRIETNEDRSRLVLEGSSGNLILTANSVLVRYLDQQIQISEPVWRRGRRDWYVPEDFLTRALPLVLDATFERISPRRYRMQSFQDSLVTVRLNNYPGYVRIVLESEDVIPVRIGEFGDHILVEFSNFRIQTRMPLRDPSPLLVSRIEFNRQNVFGALRLYKGPRYDHFREFSLQDPNRQVIDIYPNSLPVAADSSPRLPGVSSSPDTAAPNVGPRGGGPDRTENRGVIAIDPGHGADDMGVAEPEIQEKLFVLELARRIQDRLERAGFRVFLTRSRDVELSDDQRSAIANQAGANAYVSLHLGRSRFEGKKGAFAYYNEKRTAQPNEGPGARKSSRTPPAPQADSTPLRLLRWEEGQEGHETESRRLAGILQSELNSLYGSRNRTAGLPLTVLEPITAPSVLVELGYVSNSSDLERLTSLDFQDRLAETVFDALQRFLK